jgi:hypothetical protein
LSNFSNLIVLDAQITRTLHGFSRIKQKESIMKALPKKSAMIAAILSAAGIAGLMLAHAQETGTSGTVTKKPVHGETISPELAAELALVEQLPTIAADAVPRGACNFYSAQCPYWPPLPGNFYGVPVWNMGDGFYLLDDLQINYAEIEAEATASAAMTMSFKPMGGGFSPDDFVSGVPYLTIAPTGTNQLMITVINNGTPVNYELWWTPVLANPAYPWTAVAVGATGQTNFVVSTAVYPTGFYRAIWDTNGIPVWQMADPNNPGAGILAVFIDSPTNGAVIQ